MKFIVFGLGNFGEALAIRLTELGHEVIGVDEKIEKVERLKEKITHTVKMDCKNREAVSSLPLQTASAVIVAIGQNEEETSMTIHLIKQHEINQNNTHDQNTH